MKRLVIEPHYQAKTNKLRFATIAIATLLLCSCRTMPSTDTTTLAASKSLSDASHLNTNVAAAREPSGVASQGNVQASTSSLSDRAARTPNSIQQVAAEMPIAPTQTVPSTLPYPAPQVSPTNVAMLPRHHRSQLGHHGGHHPGAGCQSGCPCGNHGDPRDGQPGCFNWCPPPVQCPWKEDEYLCDGGDQNVKVVVDQDWTVRGLNLEDTVVHYDTLRGDTEVTPSNKVCIYAPRFAAVRKVYGLVQSEQTLAPIGVNNPTGPVLAGLTLPPIAVTQPLQPNRILRANGPLVHEERQGGRTVDNTWVPNVAENVFAPYEDLAIIRRGVHVNSDKARLAIGIDAALTWQDNQMVHVAVKDLTPVQIIDEKHLGQTYVYDLAGKPRVRILKIASKKDAKPGEIVDFTLRFDNVGDQPVGNVTVIDNLTTRLEYVEGSQQCSLKADFKTQENEGQSLVLRWEVEEPMKVNEGGIIRFKCRVR